MKVFKNALLSVAYLIILFFILALNNFAFIWLTVKVIAPIFEWFYDIHWFWKIIILFFGGIGFLMIFYNILTAIGTAINIGLSKVFPENNVTFFGSIILCLLNIIDLEISAWGLPKSNIWFFGLWVIIALTIIQLNWIFIFQPKNND